MFSPRRRSRRGVGLSEDAGEPFAMPPGLAFRSSSQAPPVSDQGDGCTACPSLQGALTDVSGLPGKPGPKGEPGPEGVGHPGKPVSAIGSSSHPSLPVCCFSSWPTHQGYPWVPLFLLGPAWSTRSSRAPRTEGHSGLYGNEGPSLVGFFGGGGRWGGGGGGMGDGNCETESLE